MPHSSMQCLPSVSLKMSPRSKAAFAKFLDSKNMTAYALHKKSGLSERYMYQLAKNEVNIFKASYEKIKIIADVFGLTTDEFVRELGKLESTD